MEKGKGRYKKETAQRMNARKKYEDIETNGQTDKHKDKQTDFCATVFIG